MIFDVFKGRTMEEEEEESTRNVIRKTVAMLVMITDTPDHMITDHLFLKDQLLIVKLFLYQKKMGKIHETEKREVLFCFLNYTVHLQ